MGNTVCETAHFIKTAEALWSKAELDLLKDFVAFNPLAGKEIPGTGGLRKLRWKRAGMGKRSGARVIYYYFNETAPLYLLHSYAKAEKKDLSAQEKHVLVRLVETLKEIIQRKRKGK